MATNRPGGEPCWGIGQCWCRFRFTRGGGRSYPAGQSSAATRGQPVSFQDTELQTLGFCNCYNSRECAQRLNCKIKRPCLNANGVDRVGKGVAGQTKLCVNRQRWHATPD